MEDYKTISCPKHTQACITKLLHTSRLLLVDNTETKFISCNFSLGASTKFYHLMTSVYPRGSVTEISKFWVNDLIKNITLPFIIYCHSQYLERVKIGNPNLAQLQKTYTWDFLVKGIAQKIQYLILTPRWWSFSNTYADLPTVKFLHHCKFERIIYSTTQRKNSNSTIFIILLFICIRTI